MKQLFARISISSELAKLYTTKSNRQVLQRQRNQQHQLNHHYSLSILCDNSEISDSSETSLATVEDIINREISDFNSFPFPVKEDTSPLLFFKQNFARFPLLFAIPASSVPSESLFSRVKEITTDNRNRLSPYMVEMLAVVKNNAEMLRKAEKKAEKIKEL